MSLHPSQEGQVAPPTTARQFRGQAKFQLDRGHRMSSKLHAFAVLVWAIAQRLPIIRISFPFHGTGFDLNAVDVEGGVILAGFWQPSRRMDTRKIGQGASEEVYAFAFFHKDVNITGMHRYALCDGGGSADETETLTLEWFGDTVKDQGQSVADLS